MKKKQSNLAAVAIFFAIMLVIHVLSQLFFQFFPTTIKPTLNMIPVIIASIIYGPRVGATLGFLMGLISLTHATIFLSPTSYLFTPLAPNGNLYSLMIALLPRILIGIVPYFVYKVLHNKVGLTLAGASGAITNTVFVLGGIFLLFSQVFEGDIQKVFALIISTNSVVELLISAVLTVSIVPALEKIRK